MDRHTTAPRVAEMPTLLLGMARWFARYRVLLEHGPATYDKHGVCKTHE